MIKKTIKYLKEIIKLIKFVTSEVEEIRSKSTFAKF